MIYLAIFGVISTIYFIIIYNKFTLLKASIESSDSDIDVQLKRRYNLIPALLKTVKSYMQYEGETFAKIIEARNASTNANSMEDKSSAETLLGQSLGKLFALSEDYPDLKANTTFLQLQTELSEIEEAIQNARRYYNAIVRDYNAKIDSFPDLIVARKFNFTPMQYFELEDMIQAKMPEINI